MGYLWRDAPHQILGAFYNNQIRDFTRAERYFDQALKIDRFIGDLAGQSVLLHNLALSAASRGNYNQAIDLGMQASAITKDVGNKLLDCNTRWIIGLFYFETGHYDQAKSFYDQALDILLQTPNLYHELRITQLLIGCHLAFGDLGNAERGYQQITTQMNDLDPTSKIILHMHLAFNKHQMKDDHATLKHTAEAFAILGEDIYEDYNWFGHTISGHACAGLNDLNSAEQHYKKALDLFSSMFWQRRKYDTFAGLARLDLARGDPVEALSWVEKILSHLETDNLDGTLEPYRIYLTCYHVLRANQDPRANPILTEAYNLIQERAKNISDESLRILFLENVAVNREIISECEKL